MFKRLNISLDYDETYTEDPECWNEVINVFKKYGHRVFCISARSENMDNRIELESVLDIPVFLTGHKSKRDFAKLNDLDIDVWIDDRPEAVLKDTNTNNGWI